MPTYDYQCRSCGSVTEVIHSMLEEGPSVCERCGGELRRVLYPTGIIFKGSGFYRTDSREAGTSTSSTSSKAPAADAKASDPKASDSKGSEKAASDTKAARPSGEGTKGSSGSAT